MKRLVLFAALLPCLPAGAEELKFVTVLSQPVASFARVEALNAARPATSLFVNFCNPGVTGADAGKIDVVGLVKMNELRLTGDSRAGGSSAFTYQITDADGLNLSEGGSLLGAKLLAKTANPQDVTVNAGVQVNASSSFNGADLSSLKIGSHTSVVPSSYSKGYVMSWKGDYTAAYKVTSADGVSAVPNSKYTSHLLRYRLDAEGICGPDTPSQAQSTRERDCSSDERYGGEYTGTIKEKYKYLPDCVWAEVSNTCRKITCGWSSQGWTSSEVPESALQNPGQYCSSSESKLPDNSSCTVVRQGDTFSGGCSINDYRPGAPVMKEMSTWTCVCS